MNSMLCKWGAALFVVAAMTLPAAAQDFSVSGSSTSPSCSEVSGGFVPNGTVTVTITDQPSGCGGTYNVVTTGYPPWYPLNPSQRLGVAAGSHSFIHAGPGTYTMSVTETGVCGGLSRTVDVIVSALDASAPNIYLRDPLGNIVADTDPYAAAPPDIDLGTTTVPEGTCGRQDEYYMDAIDGCDGFIFAANAFGATTSDAVPAMEPGTTTSVTTDGFGRYRLDVFWSMGTSTVTVTGKDASGNPSVVSITRTIDGVLDACVTPACDSGSMTCPNAPDVCVGGGTLFTVAVNAPSGTKFAVCSIVPAGFDGNTMPEIRCDGASAGGIPTLYDPADVAERFGDGYCGTTTGP